MAIRTTATLVPPFCVRAFELWLITTVRTLLKGKVSPRRSLMTLIAHPLSRVSGTVDLSALESEACLLISFGRDEVLRSRSVAEGL